MAIATTERHVLDLDENIAARAAALREGKPMPRLKRRFEPSKAATIEFVSAPDATEIPADEICNVELLRPAWEHESTNGWDEGDARWQLTPHELRRANLQTHEPFIYRVLNLLAGKRC